MRTRSEFHSAFRAPLAPMKQFLSIVVLTLVIVLHAHAEKFFWGGTYYEWAMVIAVDEDKKMATVMPDPFEAPEKTMEVPLRSVTKDMLDFFALPNAEANDALQKHIQKYRDKYKGVKDGAKLICGKIVGRLPDGTLLLDCPDFRFNGKNPAGKANIRLTLLAPTKLVEGNLMITFAAADFPSPYEVRTAPGGVVRPPDRVLISPRGVQVSPGGPPVTIGGAQTVQIVGPFPNPPYPYKQLPPPMRR